MNVFTSLYLCCLVYDLGSCVQVIDFHTDYNPPDAQGNPETGVLGTIPTRELTICLRFMPRYSYTYTLIKTKQLQLVLRENEGFFNLNPPNPTTSNEVYSRMFPFCKPRVPGKWVSLCFSMKLNSKTQHLKVYQNSMLCWNKTYSDGEFGVVLVKETSQLSDM